MKTPVSVMVRHKPSGLQWPDTDDRAGLWDHLLLLGLGLVLATAVLAFGSTEPWSEFMLECGAGGLFALWVVRQLLAGEVKLQPSPLYLPALAFALLVAAQLVLGIPAYAYATRLEAYRYLGYGLLMFVAIQCFHSRQQIQRFVFGMTLFGFLLAGFAIVQDMTSKGTIYWVIRPQRMTYGYGPYLNHSHWAGLMEMLTPLPLALILRRRTTVPQKMLLGLALLLMGSTIFLSGSRGGMVTFAVQVALGAALLLLRGQKSERLRDLAILAVIGVVFMVWVAGSRVSNRFEEAYRQGGVMGGALDVRFRLAIHKDTFSMFKARPVAGWGLDCFTTVFPQFQTFYTDKIVNAAHNDYLQLLAETGIIGFGLMAWFLAAMFRSALRRQGPPGFVSSAKMAALLGCCGILVHSLGDFNMHVAANAAMFYVLAALAGAEGVEDFEHGPAQAHSGPILVHDLIDMPGATTE